jgi:hypothetical protein
MSEAMRLRSLLRLNGMNKENFAFFKVTHLPELRRLIGRRKFTHSRPSNDKFPTPAVSSPRKGPSLTITHAFVLQREKRGSRSGDNEYY